MGAGAELDFTELLDDLIAASEAAEVADEDILPPSALRIDLLEQLDRLQADSKSLFTARADSAYREFAVAPDGTRQQADAAPAHLAPLLDDLFFLDPESISRELGIQARSKPDELDKARRSFAMRYHPDRVPEEFRERAALRMQIANMLIDEAKGSRK